MSSDCQMANLLAKLQRPWANTVNLTFHSGVLLIYNRNINKWIITDPFSRKVHTLSYVLQIKWICFHHLTDLYYIKQYLKWNACNTFFLMIKLISSLLLICELARVFESNIHHRLSPEAWNWWRSQEKSDVSCGLFAWLCYRLFKKTFRNCTDFSGNKVCTLTDDWRLCSLAKK